MTRLQATTYRYGFVDASNPNRLDPRRYVDASRINYVVLGTYAAERGVKLGDLVAVYSKKTERSAFGSS